MEFIKEKINTAKRVYELGVAEKDKRDVIEMNISLELGVTKAWAKTFITVYRSGYLDILDRVGCDLNIFSASREVAKRNKLKNESETINSNGSVLTEVEPEECLQVVNSMTKLGIRKVFDIYNSIDVSEFNSVNDPKRNRRIDYKRKKTADLTGYTIMDVRKIVSIIENGDDALIGAIDAGDESLKNAYNRIKASNKLNEKTEVVVTFNDDKDKIWNAYLGVRRQNHKLDQCLADTNSKHKQEVFNLTQKISALENQLRIRE